jgi:DNA-binding IclR family transcriptional regulator
VIARAAQALRCLEGSHDGLSLSEIASQTQLPRSTVHRIVRALEAERFVISSLAGGRFRLGPALAGLAAGSRRELAEELRPTLLELSRCAEETVDLAVLQGDLVVFIDQISVPHRLQAVSAVGAAFPAHCTANGKALLATLDDAQLDLLLPSTLPRHTRRTIRRRSELLRELSIVRAEGVAFDREEHTDGICAVGVAVRTSVGDLAAISIPLPAQRFYAREAELGSLVKSIGPSLQV